MTFCGREIVEALAAALADKLVAATVCLFFEFVETPSQSCCDFSIGMYFLRESSLPLEESFKVGIMAFSGF